MRSTRQASLSIFLLSAFSLSCLGRTNAFFSDSLISAPHFASRQRIKLHVSELHVPGYAESKIPFILRDDDLEELNNDGTLTLKKIEESSYTLGNSESLIPFESGHLLHKTKGPIFTKEECERIVYEAEQRASQIEWTRNRHGNFPTTDLPLVELPETLKFLRIALVERVYPLLRSQFGEFLPDPHAMTRKLDKRS